MTCDAARISADARPRAARNDASLGDVMSSPPHKISAGARSDGTSVSTPGDAWTSATAETEPDVP